MQNNTKNIVKTAALYARFSRNDSDSESDSIAHQRKILQEYAAKKGFASTKFYADDDLTLRNILNFLTHKIIQSILPTNL